MRYSLFDVGYDMARPNAYGRGVDMRVLVFSFFRLLFCKETEHNRQPVIVPFLCKALHICTKCAVRDTTIIFSVKLIIIVFFFCYLEGKI